MILLYSVILGLGAGTLALLLNRKAEAGPPEVPPVDVEELVAEIKQARNLSELTNYYYLIGNRFLNMEYSYTEYMTLYQAYEERWYELEGE